MTEFIDTDVLIIGGGPAGCSCALYTSRSSLKTYILDKNIGASTWFNSNRFGKRKQ